MKQFRSVEKYANETETVSVFYFSLISPCATSFRGKIRLPKVEQNIKFEAHVTPKIEKICPDKNFDTALEYHNSSLVF